MEMMEDKRPFLDRWYVETWLREHGPNGPMYKYELAWKAGIKGNTLSQLITGHTKPHPSTVKRLAEAMGVDPEEIMISPDKVPPSVSREYKRRQAKIRKYWRKKRLEEKKQWQKEKL